jgi:uncharacterized protein (TIGR03437 family)
VAPAITLNPPSASAQNLGTQQFTATATGLSNAAVTWSLSAAIGSLSSSGLYTAPQFVNSPQTVTVTATSTADASVSASALVSLQPTGLEGYWPFDEASGIVAHDASGSGNNGTLECSGNCSPLPTWTTGIRNGALNFSVPNDVVSVPDSPALEVTNQFTFAFWANSAGATDVAYIEKASGADVGNGSGATNGYQISTSSLGNYVYINLFNNSAVVAKCTTPFGAVQPGNWQHFAITYDGANISMYLNGVLGGTCSSSASAGRDATPLYIGGVETGSSARTLDEVRIYNRPLSALEVLSIYNDPGLASSETASAALIAVHAAASGRDEPSQLRATAQTAAATTSVGINAVQPTALTCPAGAIPAGSWFGCEVRLNASNISEAARSAVSSPLAVSADPSLKLPAFLSAQPGQTRLTFKVYAAPRAMPGNANITVQFGGAAVSAAVFVAASSGPILNLPADVNTVFGKPVSFTFSASDPSGFPFSLSASALPQGATFDADTGRFSWTPSPLQQGIYRIRLMASDSAHAASAGAVTITVDAGKPVIAGIRNAASIAQPACSPGSVASLTGRWLAASGAAVSVPSGALTELGGTRVKVNGSYAAVVYASATRVDFVCPAAEAGAVLTVSAETNAGVADAVSTTMEATAPGLYSLDGTGTGQGLVTLTGTPALAANRDYLGQGQPVAPGDSITIQATGIAGLHGATPMVKIGEFYAQVDSVRAAEEAGIYQITAEIPSGIPDGAAVPVVVLLPGPGTRESNPVTIAVERPQQ